MSHMPKTAKKGVQMADSQGDGNPDKGKALGKGLGELLKGAGGNRPSNHKPILKALGDLGIKVRVLPVMIGDEPIDCLVIPAQELLISEYRLLSGIDPNLLLRSEVDKD